MLWQLHPVPIVPNVLKSNPSLLRTPIIPRKSPGKQEIGGTGKREEESMGRRILGRYRAKSKRHTERVSGIRNVKIERVDRVGDKKRSPYRTMVAKLSSFKIK